MANYSLHDDVPGQWARILTVLAALLPPALHAQAPASTPTAPPAVAEAVNLVNPLTQVALQQGAVNCVGRINQLSNFLGFGPQAGAVLMVPASQPDQRIFPIAMEVPVDGSVAYVAATFAPNQANGCGAVYDAIVYWEQSCEALAGKQFPGLRRVGLLKSHIVVLDGGLSTKVFLMPAGSGCVSVKKEVVH